MSDIQAYLASKRVRFRPQAAPNKQLMTCSSDRYMSGAKADAILSRAEGGRPKKKKRRLEPTAVAVGDGTGLLIADEDSVRDAWGQGEPEEEDGDAPVVTQAAKTSRMIKSNWSLPSASTSTLPESLAEDTPAESSTIKSPPPVKKRQGGLLTAAQLKEEAEALAIEEARKEAERERERLEARRQRRAEGLEDGDEDDDLPAIDDDHPDHQRTVYRDRTGKIVDANAEHAERLKAEAEDRKRQAAKKDWNKGLVQRQQRDAELQRERQGAGSSFARSANDRSMNEEMRNEVRREDPAAAFLTKRKKKGPQRPKYTGPAPSPNRFGIPPGFRWDGVDRSTGYEAKLFQKINERSRKKQEAYKWSAEDM